MKKEAKGIAPNAWCFYRVEKLWKRAYDLNWQMSLFTFCRDYSSIILEGNPHDFFVCLFFIKHLSYYSSRFKIAF